MRDGAVLLPPMRVAQTQSSEGMILRDLSAVFRVFAELVHFIDEKRVGEFEFFAQSHQPLALLMVEVSQPVACLARVAAIEGDELLCCEMGVPAQRFEDAEDVMVGDRIALAARRRLRSRASLSRGRCLHRSDLESGARRCKRAACRAMRRGAT